jgi:hypothetical protein
LGIAEMRVVALGIAASAEVQARTRIAARRIRDDMKL